MMEHSSLSSRLFVISVSNRLFILLIHKILCFYDNGQERALSLFYYLEIGRNHPQKMTEAKKYELNRQTNG